MLSDMKLFEVFQIMTDSYFGWVEMHKLLEEDERINDPIHEKKRTKANVVHESQENIDAATLFGNTMISLLQIRAKKKNKKNWGQVKLFNQVLKPAGKEL